MSIVKSILYIVFLLIKESEIKTTIRNCTPYEITIEAVRSGQPNIIIPGLDEKGRVDRPFILEYPKSAGDVFKIHCHDKMMLRTIKGSINFKYFTKRTELSLHGSVFKLCYKIILLNEKKVIIFFRDKNDILNHNSLNRKASIFVKMNIPIITFSIISYDLDKRLELMFIGINDINVEVNSTKSSLDFKGSFSSVQVDNNYNLGTDYPVVLCSHKYLNDNNSRPSFFINCSLRKYYGSQSMDFSNFEVSTNGFKITVEEEYLTKMINIYSFVKKVIRGGNNIKKANHLFISYFNQRKDIIGNSTTKEWDGLDHTNFDKELHFDSLKLPTIYLELSYFQDATRLREKNFDLISIVGIALGGFEDARLTIYGIQFEQYSSTLNNIISQVIGHYKNEAKACTINIIGSLNIFGNPFKLIRGFAGEDEYVLNGGMQSEGVTRGRNHGNKVTRGFQRTIGAVGNVTGGLASGVSLLSGDADFLVQRNKIKNKKAKNIEHGLKLGAKSLFKGFKSGIFGIVKQPIKEVKKSGRIGIFKGILKGVGGIVSKPISGVLDLVSKTAEGVKNQGKKSTVLRVRLPRIFYGLAYELRQYNYSDANFYNMYIQYRKRFKDVKGEMLIESWDLFRDENNIPMYLALTSKFVQVIKENRVVFFTNISHLSVYGKGRHIFLRDIRNQNKNKIFFMIGVNEMYNTNTIRIIIDWIDLDKKQDK